MPNVREIREDMRASLCLVRIRVARYTYADDDWTALSLKNAEWVVCKLDHQYSDKARPLQHFNYAFHHKPIYWDDGDEFYTLVDAPYPLYAAVQRGHVGLPPGVDSV